MVSRRSLLAAAAVLSGSSCFGRFALTEKLHRWNGGFGSRFVSTLIFWVFLIIPVYGTCLFIDAVLLNLIEFWSGRNPLATVDHPDGSRTTYARLDEGTVRLTREVPGEPPRSLVLTLTGEASATAIGEGGEVLASVEGRVDGSLSVRSENRALELSEAQVKALEMDRQPALAAAALLRAGALASR